MTGRYFTGEPIEQRLDRLIDALNAGNAPDALDRDPELDELAAAIRSTAAVREVQWPESGFGRRMAARLSAELRDTGRFDRAGVDDRMLELPTTPAALNGHAPNATGDRNTLELTQPGNQKRIRTFAQIAAAIAGFAILAYVLSVVFRGASDNVLFGGPPASADGQIAYVSSDTGNAEIYLIDADGSDKTNLTNNPASDTMPSWSPDGEKLAFVSDRDGRDAIYIMNADGSNPRLFVDGEGRRLLYPSWSPDGSMIAYDQAEGLGPDQQSKVIARKVDGSNWWVAPIQMDRGDGFQTAVFPPLAWSPESDRLAFSGSGTRPALYIWEPQNGSIGRTELSEGRTPQWPGWSPDGGRLSYVAAGSVEVVDFSDDTTSVLSKVGGPIGSISWSLAGEALVGDTASTEASGLVLLPLNGAEAQTLTQDADHWPVWSADGTTIAFLRESTDPQGGQTYSLMTITPDGNEPGEVVAGIRSLDVGPPAWRPVGPEPDDSEQAQASVTPSTEVSRIILTPTPPSTPNASISIVPYELSCAGSAAVVGSGFAPASTVDIFLGERVPAAPDGSEVLSTTAGDDGTFQFEDLVPIVDLVPNCEERAAGGGGDLTFMAASVIEVDGEQRYAEPPAQTTAVLAENSDNVTDTTFTLDPAIGACRTTVTASGTGFEPGSRLTFTLFQVGSDNGGGLEPRPTVGEDGTFSVVLTLAPFIGCSAESEIPEAGLRFSVNFQTGIGAKEDDPVREPSGFAFFTLVNDPNIASPEALEQVMVDQATDAFREFLNEPDTTFDDITASLENRHVTITRQIGDAFDELAFDVDLNAIVYATIQSHSSEVAPSNPVDSEEALRIAQAVAVETYPHFDQLTLHETSDDATRSGTEGPTQFFRATWQLQTTSGAWLPTILQVTVDLETGLVTDYSYSHEPYRGLSEPQLSRVEAQNAIEQAIATEPTLSGATVGKAELTTSYKVLEMDDNGNVTSGEWILVWRIYLDDAPESAPGPYIDVDALTGVVLTDFGDPGGSG